MGEHFSEHAHLLRHLDVTVVVPTRDERDNVEPLVTRLAVAGAERVMFVDDSDDDTAAMVEAMAERSDVKLDVHRRLGDDRVGGLGGAVVAGFERAGTAWVAVMDADLQHPPELLGQLAATALHTGADLVVATRHNWDSINEGLGPVRTALSWVAGRAAFRLFPSELRTVSDPLSGYFLVRSDAVDLDRLEPEGFKILLEILGTHPELRTAEVPFHFAGRVAGESKGTFAEGVRYGRHLLALRRRVRARTRR